MAIGEKETSTVLVSWKELQSGIPEASLMGRTLVELEKTWYSVSAVLLNIHHHENRAWKPTVFL